MRLGTDGTVYGHAEQSVRLVQAVFPSDSIPADRSALQYGHSVGVFGSALLDTVLGR